MDRCVALPSHLPNLSYLRHTISSKKGDVLDSIDDDDDIEWPENPFDHRDYQNTELLAMIRFDGSVGFQAKPRKLCEKYIVVFSIRVRHQSAKVEPMSIVADRGKWEVSRNRLPPGHHNIDMQTAIRELVHAPIWASIFENGLKVHLGYFKSIQTRWQMD